MKLVSLAFYLARSGQICSSGANPDPGMRPLWPSRRGLFATKKVGHVDLAETGQARRNRFKNHWACVPGHGGTSYGCGWHRIVACLCSSACGIANWLRRQTWQCGLRKACNSRRFEKVFTNVWRVALCCGGPQNVCLRKLCKLKVAS